MSDLFDDVGDFHRKFGLPHTGDGIAPALMDKDTGAFRRKFLAEELHEYDDAVAAGDLEKAADALADLVYVALGTAHMMRLPFDAIWREVQRANMTKVRTAGASDPRSTRKNALDVVKPIGFVPPDHTMALAGAGLVAELRANGAPVPTDWGARMMALARHVSRWSKDPSTRVGAVLVGADRRQICHGYNGFPPGVADTPERLADRATKYLLTQHAEENALDNATFDTRGATLYTTVFPCCRCAKKIISKRVKFVMSPPPPTPEAGRWTEEIPQAIEILGEAGVKTSFLDG